jgi:hypothetical protein
MGEYIKAEAVLTAARTTCDAAASPQIDAAMEELATAKRVGQQPRITPATAEGAGGGTVSLHTGGLEYEVRGV